MTDDLDQSGPQFNVDGAYRVDVYTDMGNEIRVFTPLALATEKTFPWPIDDEFQPDVKRSVRYMAAINLSVSETMPPMRIPFEIVATSLFEAMTRYGDAAQEAVRQTMARVKEQQRTQLVAANGRALN